MLRPALSHEKRNDLIIIGSGFLATSGWARVLRLCTHSRGAWTVRSVTSSGPRLQKYSHIELERRPHGHTEAFTSVRGSSAALRPPKHVLGRAVPVTLSSCPLAVEHLDFGLVAPSREDCWAGKHGTTFGWLWKFPRP